MGIGGYILAGALQGAGNAITTQAQQDAESRRAIALQRLKTQDAMQTSLFQAKIADAADASKQERANGYAIKLAGVKTAGQQEVDTNRGNIAAQNAAADDARDFSNAKALENLRTRNDMTKADHDAAIDAVKSDKEIVRVETLASGQLMGVTKSGNTKPLMGQRNGKPIYLATAKPGDKGDGGGGATVGSTLAGRGAKSSGSAPAASPTPTGIGRSASISGGSPAPAAQTAASAAREQPNGASYSAEGNAALMTKLGTPDYFADATASMNRPTTYTLSQLREFAQQTGMSDAEARAWARKNGFTITQ